MKIFEGGGRPKPTLADTLFPFSVQGPDLNLSSFHGVSLGVPAHPHLLAFTEHLLRARHQAGVGT